MDLQKWLDRINNLLDVQKDRSFNLISANYTRRELVELRMIIETVMEINMFGKLSVHSSTLGSGQCTDEEHKEAKKIAIKALTERMWTPFPEYTPDVDQDGCSELMLVSFENFSVPMIGQYRTDNDGGASWYVGDSDETFSESDVFVNAFMPLPECYPESEGGE